MSTTFFGWDRPKHESLYDRNLELVKTLNDQARIFVRSHNDEETAFFKTQNVALTVSGTEEIARRMIAALIKT